MTSDERAFWRTLRSTMRYPTTVLVADNGRLRLLYTRRNIADTPTNRRRIANTVGGKQFVSIIGG